jgi:hypothetical protein
MRAWSRSIVRRCDNLVVCAKDTSGRRGSGAIALERELEVR